MNITPPAVGLTLKPIEEFFLTDILPYLDTNKDIKATLLAKRARFILHEFRHLKRVVSARRERVHHFRTLLSCGHEVTLTKRFFNRYHTDRILCPVCVKEEEQLHASIVERRRDQEDLG